ncbi:phage tail tip lysozyme [Enterococcus faecium]|uniref:phage tail tip lysozyme n=1 Tax=Enterococcus faecium TaxID=1352 RepID=UPI000352D4B5|nr:phage tail tip lysozyme [Enterococcus faecium]EPI26094.1 hypothetical protein D352_00144 [Enterococcus faecium LA4B-2]
MNELMKKKKILILCGLNLLPVLLFIGFFFLLLVSLTTLSEDESVDCSALVETPASNIVATNQGSEKNGFQIATEIKKKFPTTPQGLAGMLGNFDQESNNMPTAIERPNDPLSGHGIAQWTAGRTTNLMNFAKSKGKDWSDLGLQIEFLIYELETTEKAAQAALKASTVEEGTAQWQKLFERAGDPMMGNRLNYANQWYAKLSSNDPIAQVTLSNGATAGQQDEIEACMNENVTSSADGNILKVAKSWLGWFHYDQIHPAPDLGTDLKNPNKNGRTDCSGFVWLVLNKAGYKVPANMQWFTGSMASDARGAKQYLQEVSPSDAKAGDIVIVNLGSGAGNDGHTAILAEDWHGLTTKIIEQGGMNHNGVGEGQVDLSFGYLLNGGDICLARPVKR